MRSAISLTRRSLRSSGRRLPWPSKLGVTGADAVEIALRTALLATGKSGIVAFDDAYHGTGLLALAATGFERFREPFAAWLPGPVHRRPYGQDPGPLPADTCCVIAEPVQGRAGARVPPDDWLETLRRRCNEAGALLVVDAIYAGLGRVGELWPGEQVADVICVGKALGGGLPLSAALFVRGDLASVWDLVPRTFSRTPTSGTRSRAQPRWSCWTKCRGCSNASASPGAGSRRRAGTAPACSAPAWATAEAAEQNGVIVIPAGDGSLISATPPFTITDEELDEAFSRLAR